MYGKLSSPLTLCDDFEKSLECAYDFFLNNINNRAKRPVLFDKEVYIEANEQISDKPQGFWHAVSLEEKHHFKVLPCVNDVNINLCGENCGAHHHQIQIKYGCETRNICLLRASRLPWILDIIRLANKGDPSVEIWKKPSSSKASEKLYLRYNHDGADYILIFSCEKHFYRLISSFPVFYTSDKAGFSKDYRNYHWSYFSK